VNVMQKLSRTPALQKRMISYMQTGARGGVVVKVLRYKAAGRGFDSRW
jgi:hypothetical protein